ncbi:universal stress protein [Mycobacterium branderi]|uniref:Universal stress protein n=1 Tax=Mycobacterium branderi TaxID=43348 RepID=A0A7I7W7L6_9MYCO|nr:universal stress protein [Mycobacterium branderi]MCV7231166.1 universal stress protein [Mycobacterium branderi]ORA35735.1 hypothetical protein BST20_16835 [Mycobacterium branderi]BBZ12785.1 universal stress protein [Mycobacterium branderi]
MANVESPGPIVVGIDGSEAAKKAAEWAIREAIHQDVPLRLVHVIQRANVTSQPIETFALELEYAQGALRDASAMVEGAGMPVKCETAVLRGDIDSVLVTESSEASLICVGSVGIGQVARKLLGSTAAALAEHAHCPVAIIRHDEREPWRQNGFIVVEVADYAGNDDVMRWGMEEARVRSAPLLAVGLRRWTNFEIGYAGLYRRLDPWLRQYPDVQVEVAATRMSLARYLEGYRDTIQLVVIGSESAGNAPHLLGPHSPALVAHADCSVLIVRP